MLVNFYSYEHLNYNPIKCHALLPLLFRHSHAHLVDRKIFAQKSFI